MKLTLLTILLSAYAGKIHAQSESTLRSVQYISQTALVKTDLREDTNISTQAFAAPVSSLPAEIPAAAYRAPMGMLSDTSTAIRWSKLTADYAIPALTVMGDTIFSEAIHLSHRMLRSYDGGATWLTKDDGMTALDLSSMALLGNSIFCSSETKGVYVSHDQGETWCQVNKGLGNKNVKVMMASDGIVYAGTWGNGTFKSADYGKTWIPINIGTEKVKVNSLAADGNTIYMGTNGAGMFISYDLGKSWKSCNKGLPSFPIRSIALLNTNIYIASERGGVYMSSDSGQFWWSVNTGLTDKIVCSLAIYDSRIVAATQRAGVFLQSRSGWSWRNIDFDRDVPDVEYVTVNKKDIYIGTIPKGVYKITLPPGY
jgi:photosystem II stability/assembly factor-like uncharacterized protein